MKLGPELTPVTLRWHGGLLCCALPLEMRLDLFREKSLLHLTVFILKLTIS